MRAVKPNPLTSSPLADLAPPLRSASGLFLARGVRVIGLRNSRLLVHTPVEQQDGAGEGLGESDQEGRIGPLAGCS